MKKILFLTPYLPSDRAGGENFTRLLLEELSKTCQIDLIYFKYQADSFYIAPNSNIRILKIMKNSLFVKMKNFILYPFLHPVFSVRFDRCLLIYMKYLITVNQYDFLYLDHSQMFLYGKFFLSIKKILMSHDVMYQRYLRMGKRLNLYLVRCSEKKVISLPNSTIFTFSRKDATIINDIYNKSALVTNFFLDKMVVDSIPTEINDKIVFFGKWGRRDNLDGLIWFFDQVYNKIHRKIEILIIGLGLPDSICSKLSKYSNVKYLGYVKDPYYIISSSLSLVSPLFSGAGVKVKVIEALACGTPVIGTGISFEGIDANFRSFMFEADNAMQFVEIIDKLNISLSDRVGFKRRFLEKYHSLSILEYIKNL